MGIKKKFICFGGILLAGVLIFHEVGKTQEIDRKFGNERELPKVTYQNYVPDKSDFATKKMSEKEIHRGDLILVNNKVPYHFEFGDSLGSVYQSKTESYYVRDKNLKLNKEVIPKVNALMDAYYKERQERVNIISGFRSKELQTEIFNKSVNDNGEQYAKSYVANPGYSEHHSGLAVDLGLYNKATGKSGTFTGEGNTSWIQENAYRYGFILRYKKEKEKITRIKEEAWHFRYVGIPHSYIIRSKGFCFEEYIEFLKGYKVGENHLKIEIEGKMYEIYYVKGTKVPVPKKKKYTISGDNMEGFIVTVEV